MSKSQERKGRLPDWCVLFLSGGIAGTAAKTTIAPLERVKILFQIRSKHYPYTGVLPTISSIVKREGIQGLWKGNLATVIRIFPYAAVQFLSYEKLKRLFVGDSKQMNPWANLVAGSLAGAISVICTYPLDLVRVQLAVEVDKKIYSGVLDTVKKIYLGDGFTALYRGMSPTLMGILPYAGVNFASFEALKSVVPKTKSKDGKNEISIPVKLLCGGLAGALGQTVSYPLDVVRRQMQTQGYAGGHGLVHRSTLGAIKTIFSKEGLPGLFKGLTINYIKVAPAVAISFTTYESVKSLLYSI